MGWVQPLDQIRNAGQEGGDRSNRQIRPADRGLGGFRKIGGKGHRRNTGRAHQGVQPGHGRALCKKTIEESKEHALWIVFVAQVGKTLPTFRGESSCGFRGEGDRIRLANVVTGNMRFHERHAFLMPCSVGLVIGRVLPHGPRPSINACAKREGCIGQRRRDIRSSEDGKEHDRYLRRRLGHMLADCLHEFTGIGVGKNGFHAAAHPLRPNRAGGVEQLFEDDGLG